MKRAKARGFSFIELLTSIAILSVVMGAVIGALVTLAFFQIFT